MRKIIFTEKEVEQYYNTQYSEDLCCYFNVEQHPNKNCILSVDRREWHPNMTRYPGSPSGTTGLFGGIGRTEKNFIFAGLFTYMLLTQQTLNKLFGVEVQGFFHKCTGWPWISAGMAGPDYPFEKMLQEAVLYPEKAEIDNFIGMLEVVTPFMNKELQAFLMKNVCANLNNEAYECLTSKVSGRVAEILTAISNEIDDFISQLRLQ